MTSPAVAPRIRRSPAGPRPARPHIVAPRRARRTGSLSVRPAWAIAFGVVIVFTALLAGAVVHSMLVSGQARLDRTTADTRAQREQLENEQLELAQLQSPARIAQEAERMGMIHGPDDNWRTPGATNAPDEQPPVLSADSSVENPDTTDPPGAADPTPPISPTPVSPGAEMASATITTGDGAP